MNTEATKVKTAIMVDDGCRFKYHTDVLNEIFGKKLRAHMQATYKLDDEWRVWFPKLYKNKDFKNSLTRNGQTLVMDQLASSELKSAKIFPNDEPGQRIVFAHMLDIATGQKYYKFIGVFSELEGNIKKASCRRISDRLYFDGQGRFDTMPLHS